jgi:hypothetical protein
MAKGKKKQIDKLCCPSCGVELPDSFIKMPEDNFKWGTKTIRVKNSHKVEKCYANLYFDQ